MPEVPPVHLPGEGFLLPDGTHVTEAQAATAVDRISDLLDQLREMVAP